MDVDHSSGDESSVGQSNENSRWVKIQPLSAKVHKVEIMKLLRSVDVKLETPFHYFIAKEDGQIYHSFKAQSARAAKRFIEKFNGFEMEQNDGESLDISQCTEPRRFSFNKEMRSKFEQSQWLKIENLNPDVSEERLKEHIEKIGGKVAAEVDLRRHPDWDTPAIAFVQMKNAVDANKVVEGKAQMSKLKGRTMWIQKFNRLTRDRCADRKEGAKEVILRDLSLETDVADIKAMCTMYGDIEGVRLPKDYSGYPMRLAFVTMKTTDGAVAVFKELHKLKVKGCTITTAFPCESYVARKKERMQWKADKQKAKRASKVRALSQMTKKLKVSGQKKSKLSSKGKPFYARKK